MWMKRFLAGVIMAALAAGAAADGYYVNPECGDDAWSGLSPDCVAPDGPKATIQAAIDVAVDGDEVILATATYTGDGNRDVDFLGKAITVRSVDPYDPDVVDATVIDCQGSAWDLHRGFTFTSAEGPDSILAGVTIVNGWAPIVDLGYGAAPHGGAILCVQASPVIHNCVLLANMATSGGAIHSTDGSPRIIDCGFVGNECLPHFAWGAYLPDGGGFSGHFGSATITGCAFLQNVLWSDYSDPGYPRSTAGGAIALWECDVTITDSEFRGNRAEADLAGGGAVDCIQSEVIFVQCTITGNSAGSTGFGGGVSFEGENATSTMVDCVVAGNQALSGGGIWTSDNHRVYFTATNCTFFDNRAEEGPGLWCPWCDAIANSIIWNGEGSLEPADAWTFVDYCDLPGGWDGDGNIDAYPLFVDPGYWDGSGTSDDLSDDFWIDGDLDLGPGSPCIDAGDNNRVPPDLLDLDGDGDTDEPLPLDVAGAPRCVDDPDTEDTGSGEAPIVDMGAYEFQPGGLTPGDLNCDGSVDFFDIQAFVLAITDPAAYEAQYPDCDILNGDCNGDGVVDFFDIDSFVELVIG